MGLGVRGECTAVCTSTGIGMCTVSCTVLGPCSGIWQPFRCSAHRIYFQPPLPVSLQRAHANPLPLCCRHPHCFVAASATPGVAPSPRRPPQKPRAGHKAAGLAASLRVRGVIEALADAAIRMEPALGKVGHPPGKHGRGLVAWARRVQYAALTRFRHALLAMLLSQQPCATVKGGSYRRKRLSTCPTN